MEALADKVYTNKESTFHNIAKFYAHNQKRKETSLHKKIELM